MGEVLFFPTCVPDKFCDDSWFFPFSFLAAVIGVLMFMYQEEIFGIGNKLFAKKNTEDSHESDTTRKGRVKDYNKETTKDMGYFKTVFYFYQCVPLLTVQTNLVQSYLMWTLSPIITALASFKPLSLFINICPIPGMTHVSRTLLGNLTTFLTFVLLGAAAVANKMYCCWKVRYGNRQPEPRSEEEDACLLSSGQSQPSGNSGPSMKARIAFATVNLFLFSYVNIASVTWQMIGCIQLGDDLIMYFDGVQTCYQPWQYVFLLIFFVHVMPFFLVVIVSRSLLESDKISVTQFFLSYILPLPMLLFWFCVYLKDIFQKFRTCDQFRAKFSKQFTKANSEQSNDSIQEVDYDLISVTGPLLINRGENPIDNIIESCYHDDLALDDDETLSLTNEEEHSIKAEILLVVSEPYVNHDNPSQSVKYWEGVLILRRLALSLCAVVYPNELLTTTLQTAICLLSLVWHVSKQPFGSRGPNNLETFFLTSLTGMSALHMIQGTLATTGVKAQGPTLAQMFVTDWIELVLQAALPLLIVAYI